MKKLREIRTKIDAYIQTHKPAAFIMWLLVLLFPLWLSLSGNAISFLSGEDGAAVLLRTLLTENYGAFLLGMLLIYLFFGAMVCLWKHVPLAALLTGLIFTIMPTVDFLKTEILKEHFLPWDMLLAKNADSFTTFLSALKIPTPLWWLWGGRRDGKQYQLSHEEILSRYGDAVRMSGRLPDALSVAMGNQFYMATFPEMAAVDAFFAAVSALV